MNTVITFTPASLVTGLLAFCAGISCIAAAINWIAKGIQAAKAPREQMEDRVKALEDSEKERKEQKLDGRVEALEKASKEHDRYLRSDKRRLEAVETCVEESNQVVLKAILSLLSHGINGNDKDAMLASRDEIQDYLTSKKHFAE